MLRGVTANKIRCYVVSQLVTPCTLCSKVTQKFNFAAVCWILGALVEVAKPTHLLTPIPLTVNRQRLTVRSSVLTVKSSGWLPMWRTKSQSEVLLECFSEQRQGLFIGCIPGWAHERMRSVIFLVESELYKLRIQSRTFYIESASFSSSP